MRIMCKENQNKIEKAQEQQVKNNENIQSVKNIKTAPILRTSEIFTFNGDKETEKED